MIQLKIYEPEFCVLRTPLLKQGEFHTAVGALGFARARPVKFLFVCPVYAITYDQQGK